MAAYNEESVQWLYDKLQGGYDTGSIDEFKEDLKDDETRKWYHKEATKMGLNVGDEDTFRSLVVPEEVAPPQRTGTVVDQTIDDINRATGHMPLDVQDMAFSGRPQQAKVTVKPGTTQQQSAPVYNYTYFDESAIDPNEGELRMGMKPANWAYSERVNRSRGSHTKDNSPILRMSLDGGKLDAAVEREALADLKGMSDDEIYKYTNDLYNLAWGSLTNDQRRDAASRLAAAGYELHVRDLGLGHAGDVDRNTNEVQTNLQDPKLRKLYDQGKWADPVDALSRQYDRLFAEQATGGTMGQQQATKMANRVLRAADKDQMFTWALQEAERTGGDPYKIYENIYDRFHAAVKEKLGAYNTRGQAAGLLGDIDAMISEKWRAAEEADRSRGFNFWQMLVDAENGGTRIADRLMDDPEMWALEYAKRTIEGVNNMIAEADHNAASGNFGAWLESSFAGGAVRGFGQAVFDVRTWDMGFGDVRDATALMTALDKSDKGQPLTKAEQAMLDAKAVELAANAYFKSQVGYGYEAGKVTGESLPFMLEMMINPASKTGGLAVNKLVRYALKRFPQRGAAAVERQAVRAAGRKAVRSAERSVARSLKGKILESAGLIIETAGKKTAGGKAVRAAVKTAGNVAGSAVMAGTTGLPGVIADTQNRMIGQLDYDADEAGKVHVTGHGFGVPMIEAFKDALVARGIENVTEMSEFDVLSNWLGGLTRKALDKLHMSDVYKFFDDIRMSDVAKVVQDFEKNTHWQGTFGEYLEEVEGGILNAWLVGDQTLDQDPETGVFNVDNNVKTFLGVSLLGGVFSAVQTVGYRTPKARMRKDIDDADKQASELWGGTWQQFKNSVDGADDKEMEVLLANIVANGNYSVDQRRAAAQYIKSVVAYRGAMKGEEIRAVDGESNPEAEQSYEQGYQVQGREREQVQDDLQRAEQRLDELDFDLSTFDGWTSDAFERRIASGEHEYTDEDIDAIREYFRAKAASDGMHQRVEDDIDTQVQQASDLVDKQTNQGTGMVHRAVLNEQHGSQEVFVTGGQLVMTGDGTMIDTEASDESLFVYNPATGQAEQYNPSDFESVDDPVNPEQLKSEAAMDIRQAFAQQAEADMNGYVQQGESYDMVDEQGNALHGTVLELRPDKTAVVQVDGEQIPLALSTQQLQKWVDNAKQARKSVEPAALPSRSAGASDNTANTGRVGNATDAAPVEERPAEEQAAGPYTAVNIDGTRADDRGQLGIRPEDEAYFLKTMSPRMMGLLNKVAKSLGWKIRLYNGVSAQERGLYNDGVVWVNRRAMTIKLAQWILGHEMTHGMGSRTRSGETFKDYKAMATAYHRSQVGDEQYEREVAALIEAYQNHLRSLGMDTSVVTREYVEEEIACDVTGDLLTNNPEMIGKMFSGVESPGKVKGIIDMIVDFLNSLKSKLPWRSEEREAFDDLINRLNNLYRDAKAQTDIAKATAREEGSRIESGEGEREGSSFSITGNAEGKLVPIEKEKQEDAMPMTEVDGKMKPDFLSTTPERGHRYIFEERGLSVDNAKVFVENNRKVAEDELAKLVKKEPLMGIDLDEFEEKHGAWQSQVDALQSQLDYWNAVADLQARIEPVTAVNTGDEGGAAGSGAERVEKTVSPGLIDPRTMSDEERQRRGDMLRNAPAIEVDANQIVSTQEQSARKAAEAWWDNNVGEPHWYDTEVGEVEINRNSVESSLAHGYGQIKLDAITSLVDGFGNAVYLGTMPDGTRQEWVQNHYFAYPIVYNGKRCYVFCRALHDNNTNRLYVHEVFVEEGIKKGNTLQTAASQPHGGIALYRDILANVLDPEKEASNRHTTAKQSAETAGASLTGEQSGTTPETSMNAPTTSGGKGSTENANVQENSEKNVGAAVADVEAEVDTEPTDGQKEAGNYKKGHVKIDGFDVTIEQPKGSVRSGVDGDGKAWSQEMHNTYGYIRGTEGVDGDHIDVFLSDHLDSWNGMVYVVDQVNKDGSFDEHKVMYGFNSEQEAREAYLSNYEEGWTGLGNITGVSRDEFKKWVDSSHRKTKPFAEYKSVKAVEEPTADNGGTAAANGTETQGDDSLGGYVDKYGVFKYSRDASDMRDALRSEADGDRYSPRMRSSSYHTGVIEEGPYAGQRYTIRISDHPAKLGNFWGNDELEGRVLSIVIADDMERLNEWREDFDEIDGWDGDAFFDGEAHVEQVIFPADLKLTKNLADAVVLWKKTGRAVGVDDAGNAVGLDYGTELQGARFSLADKERKVADPFYSNAERAVLGVKQGKANAEQWKAMLTKAGGIKAGEDNWMGLSQWLDEHKGETLTKDEVLEFVRQNGVQMEERNYEDIDNSDNPRFIELQDEYDSLLDNVQSIYDENAKRLADFVNEMENKYGEDWSDNEFRKITPQEKMTYKVLARDQEQSDPAIYGKAKVAYDEMVRRYGDDFGIAFSANKSGLYISDYDSAAEFLGVNAIHSTRLEYTTDGLENKREIAFVVPDVEGYQENDEIHFGPENEGKAVMWVRFGEARDADGNRVLVIDEIQSNRHQDGRERGYRTDEAVKEDLRLQRAVDRAQDRYDNFTRRMGEKYDGVYEDIYADMTDAERAEAVRLERAVLDASEAYNNQNYNDVPAAPFEKNWQEVAMKRMLRLAAEEGFDKVAWTTGEQQAERYDIGKRVDKIEVHDLYDGLHEVQGFKDGKAVFSQETENGERGLAELLGKDMARKAYSNLHEGKTDYTDEKGRVSFTGDNLQIGGEGMKGFYDQILPRFMDKYGKKWGVKTGEVTLDTPGKDVMHSVDVTPEMKRSVMTEGQPLFSLGDEVDNWDPEQVSWEREAVMRDALVEVMRAAGIEVVEDKTEAQRVLTEARGHVKLMSKNKKTPQETVVPGDETPFKATVVSSDAGAKVLQSLDTYAENVKNLSKRQKKSFISDVGKLLNARRYGTISEYADFETVNGNLVTIRLSDHNAHTSGFDHEGRENGISIVISRKDNEGIVNDGNAHLVEFFYSDKQLNRAEGDVYGAIVRSIMQTLYSGEYTDTTGIAYRQEVNFFRTEDGAAYGFTIGDKMYIDPEIATSETPIHEYTHLWCAALRRVNPAAWARLKEALLGQKDVLEHVKKLYPELEGDELMDEVFAHYSGRRGADRLRREEEAEMAKAKGIFDKARVLAVFDRIRRALDNFWLSARHLFAGKVEGIEKLSAEDFADMAIADLLGGFNPTEEVRKLDADGRKAAQLRLVTEVNAMTDTYHTGIRRIDDIKTYEEAVDDGEGIGSYPDFTEEDARTALERGRATVYSSHPIEPGSFVSMSRMEAEEYAGGGEVYSQDVPLEDVAWIYANEGQYAPVGDGGGAAAHGTSTQRTAPLFQNAGDGDIEAINERFNEQLQRQIDGTLPKGHVYELGMPGDVLLSTGIANVPIQLNSTRLEAKSSQFGHDFDLSEIKDLVKAINVPVAVFSYGDKNKAQNIIVEIQHEGKNFVVGLSIRPSVAGRVLEINSIRNVFPKKNAEWLNWINQDKLLYVDKEKIQTLIDQQRTILADVDYLDLDSAAKVVKEFVNPTVESEKSDGRDAAAVVRANSAQYNNGEFDRSNPDIRFSLSGDGTVEEYNRAVNMTGRTFNVGGREVKPGLTRYNFQEAFQDAILSVKKLQQVVERHFGIKLPTRENAWMYENRLSSINMHERKSFIDKVYEPMMKIADRIMKRGVKEKELNAYLICKHGLERNRVFAERDAQAEYDEIVRNGGTADLQQLIDEKRQRDYSGLTGVTGIQGDIADIEAEAQRIVDEFEQRHGQLCDELWDAVRKATQWSLRKSYQSGMMSSATFVHVRDMFQYYIPLRGWSEKTAEDVYSYMMVEHGVFNGVLKWAEGRTSVADDPLATIGNMAESALIQGNRNLLKQHLLRMAQNHPTDVCQVRDVWLVEGPGGVWEPHWPNIPDDATPDEIDQILQDHEADMQQLEASGQAKRVRNNLDIPYRIDPRHVPEHAVVAKVADVDHVIYINGNPRAAQAINGQTGAPREMNAFFKFLVDHVFGDMKRFYSSVLTSLNINFSGANFVRDLPHAYAMTFSKYGPLKAAEYIAKSFQVFPWVFKNQLGKTGNGKMDRYFQEFLSSGSVTGYAHINDVDAWKANNKRRFARLSALGKAKVAVPRALGAVIDAIGWFSETLELIPRFTAFLVERQAGKDIATATKSAKDITTNFNKKGSDVTPGVWGAVATTLRYMKMFFNPIVQGMYQFVDVASMGKENKWVGPRMVLATMHLPVLGAIVPYLNQFLLEALGGDDDDDYWLLNEYTRRNNVCIFTGNGYLKIPIAPVFRELYGMGEVVATRHAGKADNEKTAIDLIDQLRTMGSVEGQSSYNEWSLARFLLPEHFAPFIDVMNNENFTGGPIYYDNNYREYAPEYTKAKKSTWSPLVSASKWLNEMRGGDEDIAAPNSGKWMNPAVWQHLITNVGGGFAQLAGDVVSGVADITEGKEIDASNIPVVKRFYSGSSAERAQWARFGIYKDYEKEYTMAKEKYQALDKRGLSLTERAEEVSKFAATHPKAAAIYAVWEGGIKGADIPQQLSKLDKDDPEYWDLVKEAVGKAEKAMNSGYVRAWEQKRKDRPDSMSDKELNDRFDKSDNDSIRHIMGDEIAKRAGSQDFYGRDAQAAWGDKSVAAWEAYQDNRISDDIKADAELSNLLKVDEGEKDKERIKMLGYIKDELKKIRRGKDATTRSAGVKGLGEGDDQRVMNELRAARKQLIEDLKNGSAEQAYRNLERRTMRLGLRKKAKEL